MDLASVLHHQEERNPRTCRSSSHNKTQSTSLAGRLCPANLASGTSLPALSALAVPFPLPLELTAG